ncbi:hypothetical protein B7494_g4066 [Chlorociboria aeruginascens]|nr:hypothetical protein B7494_g4066 [Chlorociboria aeruginascens]
MGTPAKRRKLNSSTKSSPSTSRSLDYFFGKQNQKQDHVPQASENAECNVETPSEDVELTDEQLARKLQAEWDNEVAGERPTSQVLDVNKARNWENNPASQLVVEHTGDQTKVSNEQEIVEENRATKLELRPPDIKGKNTLRWNQQRRQKILFNGTQSRIKIVDTLVNLLRIIIEGDPSSLLPTVWLATNAISPAYISLELGLGGSAISKALKNVCGLDGKSLKTLYDKHGDAGDCAAEAKKRQSFTLRKPKPLTIKGVYQSLVKIAGTQGTGSVDIKQKIVDRLLQDARGAEESRYIVRTLCQHLRIGAVKTTMLIALSRAFLLSRPPGADFPLRSRQDLGSLKKEALAEIWSKAEETVKSCFAKRPNYNDLIPVLLEIGVCDELLIRCGLTLHIPLLPMLGSITRDLSEMLTKLQGRDFSCEYKYDGQRAQVHCDVQGKVSIFSRHLELMTDKYPDLVSLIPQIRGEGVSSFIMEGEVVAVDGETGELKTFQTLTNRARKDVAIGSIKVQVCLFAFDLMYLNGESLLNRPFRERRELLRSLFTEIPRQFTWVKSIDATSLDSESVLEFFKSATDMKCEGIMVKTLDNLPNPKLELEDEEASLADIPIVEAETIPKSSKGTKNQVEKGPEKKTRRKALLATYEPDKRLDSWLKVKKDYSSTFDTLDLIPIAGWHGQGRKSKWWSPILLAVRNPESGSLEAVCKCISGFTDTFYKSITSYYSPESENTIPKKPMYVEYDGGHPDVWFEPKEVWEMAFADLTLSPVYSAARGLVSEERGLSMRFPRFLRKREDKGIEEASTSEFLAGLYRKQEEKVIKEVLHEDEE